MSLILEALRKLERDKDAPERGFVVLAHVPWARAQSRSRLVGLGVLTLALAVAGLAAVLWRGHQAPAEGALATARPSPPPPNATPATLPTLAAPPSLPPSRVASPAALRAGGAAPGAPAPRPETALAVQSPPTPRLRVAAEPELRLNAISRRDDLPVAVLNDRLVREGDVFDGIRVIRIGETEVEVEVRGKRRVLTF